MLLKMARDLVTRQSAIAHVLQDLRGNCIGTQLLVHLQEARMKLRSPSDPLQVFSEGGRRATSQWRGWSLVRVDTLQAREGEGIVSHTGGRRRWCRRRGRSGGETEVEDEGREGRRSATDGTPLLGGGRLRDGTGTGRRGRGRRVTHRQSKRITHESFESDEWDGGQCAIIK